MLIHLIRNQPKGSAITGRLVINGRYFCNTLERVGYQIPALCYPVRVTMSPRFKRLLPIVQNVPRTLPVFTSDSAHEFRSRSIGVPENLLIFWGEEKWRQAKLAREFHLASPFRRRSGGNLLRSTS